MYLESRYRCRAFDFYFVFLKLLCGLHSTQKNASLAIGVVDNTAASPHKKAQKAEGSLKSKLPPWLPPKHLRVSLADLSGLLGADAQHQKAWGWLRKYRQNSLHRHVHCLSPCTVFASSPSVRFCTGTVIQRVAAYFVQDSLPHGAGSLSTLNKHYLQTLKWCI